MLDTDGVLTISGAGPMNDYSYYDSSSFHSIKNQLNGLKIEQGVTTIGNYAFRDCGGFTGILTIPVGVTTIGAGAFWGS